jgi:hypothetical protein
MDFDLVFLKQFFQLFKVAFEQNDVANSITRPEVTIFSFDLRSVQNNKSGDHGK